MARRWAFGSLRGAGMGLKSLESLWKVVKGHDMLLDFSGVGMRVHKGVTKTVDTGVTVHVTGTGAVGDSFTVGNDQTGCSGEFSKKFAHDGLHRRREDDLNLRPE